MMKSVDDYLDMRLAAHRPDQAGDPIAIISLLIA